MAILNSVPGLRVTVQCDGRTLEEYPDDEEFKHPKFSALEDYTTSHFIECVTDAEFQVKCEILPGFQPDLLSRRMVDSTHTTFWVDVDGKTAGGWHNSFQSPTFVGLMTEAVARVNESEVSRRKLKFCNIRKVDDADDNRVRSDIELAEGLGEIVVHVHATFRSWTMEEFRHPHDIKSSVNEISEKALKGQTISHGVAFGPERRAHHPVDFKRSYPNGYSRPFAIFRFKYRSREALQQELIIPRSPSPDAVIMLNHDNNRLSNRERLAQLKREMERIKSEVKEEEGEAGDEDLSRRLNKRRASSANSVETISSGRAYKTSRSSNGTVVVDLTDDD